jgi:hypothetical protein
MIQIMVDVELSLRPKFEAPGFSCLTISLSCSVTPVFCTRTVTTMRTRPLEHAGMQTDLIWAASV